MLRRLWFERLKQDPLSPLGTNSPFVRDMLRVTLTGVAQAASANAMDRTDARKVRERGHTG